METPQIAKHYKIIYMTLFEPIYYFFFSIYWLKFYLPWPRLEFDSYVIPRDYRQTDRLIIEIIKNEVRSRTNLEKD